MKKYSKIIFILLAFLGSACTDLELSPKSEAVPDVVFQDPDSYRQFLAKVYAGLSTTGQQGPAGSADIQGIDEGFSSYVRMLFYAQELPTETAHIGWNDQTIKDFAFHAWNSDDPFITGLYYRLFYQVTIANAFLLESTEGKLSSRGFSDDIKKEIETYRTEARFLRALSYWHALDLFRNIPFFTEEDLGAEAPDQGTPQEVFDFIESELLAIENALPGAGENQYGRADRAAAWTLLAKLYLNAEVYTGQNRYADCLTYCSKVIDSGVYELNPVFQNNFNADNHTSPEFIFPVTFDGIRTQGYGGTTFLTHATVGGAFMNNADYGIDNAWGGVRVTRQFVELFPDVTGDIDSRAIFFTEGQNIDVTVDNVGAFENGYAMPKFTNITSEGETGSNLGFPDTDFPMFRLADVYLMYAECVVRGGGGDMGTAVEYVNRVRERAYGDDSGNITEAELTEDFLLDERGRELAYECHRRTDRVRFGKFTTEGLWQLKGRADEGVPTPAWRNIYPIPSAEIIANPKLKQNDEY